MKYRILCALAMALIIIIVGLHQNGVALFEYNGEKEGNFTIQICSDAQGKEYYDVYNGIIENKKFLIYVPKENQKLDYGDIIKAKANYQEPDKATNTGCFDYSLYLKTKKIYGIFKVEKIEEISKSNNKSIIYNIQKYIKETFRNNLKKENAELAIGLILGDRSNISDEIQEAFKNANLTHMLAISGAHFSYIIMIVTWICKKLKNKRLEQVLLILSIIGFMNLTGNTPSVVRAGIMSIMLILASILKRKNDFYTTLSLSLIIQIINNPYVIFDLGLILSYSGVIGIVTFYEFFRQRIKLKIVSVTLSANVLIIPIMIYNFNTISFTFIISNVLASGLLGLIIIIEFISIIFRCKPIFVLLDICLSILTKIASFCSKLPFSKIYVSNYAIFVVIAIYIIIYLIVKMKKKSIPIIIIFVLLFNFTVVIFRYSKFEKDELQINFIDVNQGDCTLLINKGKTIMIDTGGQINSSYDIGKNILHRYLLYKGITKLDYLMLSHFDADHCQAGIFILENMKVENLIISKQPETSFLYEQIMKIAKQRKIKVLYVKKGDKFNISNLKFEIIHPKNEFITNNPLNNNAIVSKISYYNFKMLFTGDIEEIAEKTLLKEDLQADLLKVGHHGSKTSTTKEFLDKVNPKIALIGVGENNKFGHPNDGVIKRLEDKNIKIYRTDKNGEINVNVSKNGRININCYNY